MSNTTRQNIFDTVEAILTGITSIKHIQVAKISPVDLDTCPFPAAFVYSGPEVRQMGDQAVIGYETWLWQLMIEVWARDTVMETLLQSIHTAMFADEDLSGYAVTSYRTGVDFLVVDPERSLQSMLVEYTILYRHVKGVM